MSEKFPANGTPAEQASNLRKWGCGGCWRAAAAIEQLGARLAEERETSRDYARKVDKANEQLADAEQRLERIRSLVEAPSPDSSASLQNILMIIDTYKTKNTPAVTIGQHENPSQG
jgi:hypothetical protein